MNCARAKMQENLRKNVEQGKIERATKEWNENQRKVVAHKRSDKPYSEEWQAKIEEDKEAKQCQKIKQG